MAHPMHDGGRGNSTVVNRIVPLYTWYFLLVVSVLFLVLLLAILYLEQLLCFAYCKGKTCCDSKTTVRKAQEKLGPDGKPMEDSDSDDGVGEKRSLARR